MAIMASGIARGRVRTTTTTMESRNMAAILNSDYQTQFESLGKKCTARWFYLAHKY